MFRRLAFSEKCCTFVPAIKELSRMSAQICAHISFSFSLFFHLNNEYLVKAKIEV